MCTKSKYLCFNEVIWLMIVKMKLKMKSRSQQGGLLDHKDTTQIGLGLDMDKNIVNIKCVSV